jgi:NAD(P)-dependent dehydrogenase (short-subunit alcohol dehydrogenase family)
MSDSPQPGASPRRFDETKTILITGVTRGLGRAMLEEFHRFGHRVIGCGRSRQAVDALRQEFGRGHWFDTVNVADDVQVQRWARHVLAEFEPPDFLVNNAAIMNDVRPLWQVPAEEFGQVLDVNVKGVANVIRHFVPAMNARGSGIIVNFSSGWGRSTDSGVAPYCASKWAIEGLTRALAQELPAGVAAMALNPGVINTDLLRRCWPEHAASFETPGRWARRVVPWLLTLDASVNGKALTAPAAS